MGTVIPSNVSTRKGSSRAVMPVIQVDENGDYAGGAGGGDATAANQELLLAELQDINANTASDSSAIIGATNETMATSDGAAAGLNGYLKRISYKQPADYETVAASQTDQILGATGAVGDYLSHVLIVPATTGAGTVSIKDGNGSAINVFVTGTLASLVPFAVPIGAFCVNATTPGWKITTGANVSCIAFGNFT